MHEACTIDSKRQTIRSIECSNVLKIVELLADLFRKTVSYLVVKIS